MIRTLQRAATLALGFGVSGSITSAAGEYRGNETTSYEIEQVLGAAEVRRYEPHVLAIVTVEGSQDQALSRGFSVLARYIFGGNTSAAAVAMTTLVAQSPSEKIAMTTPVAQVQSGGNWDVAFMMPSIYRMDTLPIPNDTRIRFVEVPERRQIVLQFSGRANTAKLDEKTNDLRRLAEAAAITLGAGPSYFFYDDPMTLPWNRRNEVAFELN